EQRRNHRTLPRPFFLNRHDPVFKDAGSQPFLDEPDDALVADPMLQEADNPLLGNFREERSDVGVQYVVHFLAADSDDHCSSASCWLRFARTPYENPRKSSSWIALSTAATALWTILSSSAATASGRLLPSSFGLQLRRDGSARYVPAWTRACSVSILRSRSCS